ncbi:DUF222 domain-containing protein, partial [Rhodococcus sp. MALMAid1271]|uniref:DUF222 domain-containing protein n=1 Tax=Rhodococcus sp. MALMAid1271 TaxID=3411744 RepID=UPI003B9EDC9D
MSEGRFCVDPELRAYLEALFSKAAKPGVNNPADPTSVVHDDTDSTSSTPEPEPTSGPAEIGDARLWDDTTPEDTAGSSNNADSSNTAESSNTADSSDSGDDETMDTAARDAAARDLRSQRERCHDALKLALRHTLASGTLGTHRGLPVTAIITMTLKDLDAGCGYAMTAT